MDFMFHICLQPSPISDPVRMLPNRAGRCSCAVRNSQNTVVVPDHPHIPGTGRKVLASRWKALWKTCDFNRSPEEIVKNHRCAHFAPHTWPGTRPGPFRYATDKRKQITGPTILM